MSAIWEDADEIDFSLVENTFRVCWVDDLVIGKSGLEQPLFVRVTQRAAIAEPVPIA